MFQVLDALRQTVLTAAPALKTRVCGRNAASQFYTAHVLLTMKADANRADHHGNTALMFASLRGDVALCQLLLGAGAEIDVANADGYS